MTLMQAMFKNYYQDLNKLDSRLLNIKNNKEVNKLKYLKNQKELILITKSNENLHFSSSKLLNLNKYVESKFISRSFWHKLINQYWQETIFISMTTPLSDNHINKLKISGLSIYQENDYKNFVLSFSKDLINGKIHVSLNENYNKSEKNIQLGISNNNRYVKYVWRKGINWHISCLYFKYLSATKIFLKKNPSLNLTYININSLPIFTISNQNNKLIMAESADQILTQKNILQLLYNWYNTLTLKNIYLRKLYTGLLFINPEDAAEYKDYINYKHLQSSKENHLKFFIGQFNLYYKLLYSSASSKEFRLIPDLKELSDLVYQYQYYKNIIFDKQQNYGKNYFQGQPIYIIQPVLVKNKNTNKQQKIDYFYAFKENNEIINYKAIFLNYETAIIAWNKFKEKYMHCKLPKKPCIYVSNLENFVKVYNKTNKNSHFIFIPSPQTYSFIKSQKQFQYKSYLKYALINQSLYIKSLCQRFIWSLTSRQPINW